MATIKKEFGNTRKRSDLTTLVYGKVPPQATEIEEAIIGACMLERDAFDMAQAILRNPDAFYKDAHQKIYAAMQRLIQKGDVIDLLTVTDELTKTNELELVGGAYTLTRLTMTVTSSAHIENHCRIVLEKFMQRELIRLSGVIIGEAYDGSSDVFDLIDFAQNGVKEILENVPEGNTATPIGETYSEILMDIEEKKNNPDTLLGIDTGYQEINDAIFGWQPGELIILAARPAMGKCFGKGTKILMFDGSFKNVEDIVIGDKIMGDDSTCRNVLNTGTGREQMYWIRQKIGIDYRVNESHILSLKRSRNEYSKKHGEVLNIEVREFITKSDKFKSNFKGYKKAVQFQTKKLPIPPYLLGLWLGDGSSAKPEITKPDIEIRNYLQEYADNNGYTLRIDNEHGNKCTSYAIVAKHRNKSKNFVSVLRELNVLKNKHIPTDFLINSRHNRLQLLAGLIDTDGYLIADYGYEVVQKSKLLIEQIKYLADTLGFKTIVKNKIVNGIAYYRLNIYGDVSKIPCKIGRKIAPERKGKSDMTIQAISIEKDIVDDYYGFEIDGNKLFMLEDCTVTHNTAFALNLALNGATSHINRADVLIYSLEATKKELVKRMAACKNDVYYGAIRKGILTEYQEKLMIDGFKDFHNINILVPLPKHFPIAGRAAKITNSPGCHPKIASFISW